MNKQKNFLKISIKPRFIRNEQGEPLEVYLDIKAYNAILDTLKALEQGRKGTKNNSTKDVI